eukprot:scaffold360_cov374-Pavlova_lutheri.AAC.82
MGAYIGHPSHPCDASDQPGTRDPCPAPPPNFRAFFSPSVLDYVDRKRDLDGNSRRYIGIGRCGVVLLPVWWWYGHHGGGISA